MNRETLHTLKRRLERTASLDHNCVDLLGFSLNLDSGDVYDRLQKNMPCNEKDAENLHVLIAHYATTETTGRTGKLVTFHYLPGGHAYEKAFIQRAVQPVAAIFGDNPEALVKSAKLLDGTELAYGDVSVEIPFLEISTVYILWKTGEFPASATILFDESVSHYLPTEDLAVLAQLTTIRLEQSWVSLRKKQT